ncbi:pyridoxal-5'-phosphate dependent enzyme class III [Amycolatopsis mediterranei S699]|uniref:Pyridoxal phosphate homeostasis protein n=2 Tax=Amycolatopsis mediterranei TaxID=33910 RepID=A0A0H3D293_AMYMU|nr:YggS family pyridoxal phosphate-dependent enzyme [Amycolatopsis mediterranei]ADJ44750.1 pyridoxal-5'-phosphate dependent enzyme class III [Amycolatopsis mediterranei U32]AEK41495.1 pyridoxal-5'-phosphate dependent enzyme class III [Amycolatopsis mediterranei S699]AFO76461.1 pyridoxal-5'-phosphate dependent enzyme class III [Amycolatopsis mediterranei S699]AGT83590.1 pyridoxal-5'-phosphate dependent enzyme class III [Amycolatopsis mediterranei RB]KDO07426.1 alanine racemase [Amycolatopsis me
MTSRKAELAENLAEVEERIAAACRAAGRARDEVKLIAITKTFPASDVALLAELGVTDVGENRDQEAGPKAAEVAARLRWHMVGRLQRNKARSVVGWAHEVQSVDSARLADALAKAVHTERYSGKREEPLDVLIQASLDDDPGRGGCPLAELPALADHIAQSGELRLRGLMAVAPLGADPAAAFERLARAGESLRKDHPNAADVSAGMSHDLEQAITHGSTSVRVGTALLGGRGLASP